MMKNVLVWLTVFMLGTCYVYSQYNFPIISGPFNVEADANPAFTVSINDIANTAGVPLDLYDSFLVSADWEAVSGSPFSGGASLTFNTVSNSISIIPPTTGGTWNGNLTNLTFEGELSNLYDPSTDGTIELVLDHTAMGTSAQWTNIIVTLFPQPSCLEPTDLGTNSLTAFSTNLVWTEIGTADSWNIELVESGDTPTGIPTYQGVSSPYAVSELTPGTDYQFYVQSDCGGGDISAWSAPFSFTTLCAPISPPYLEDFGNIIPNCWLEADNGDPDSGPSELVDTWTWSEGGLANNGWIGAYRINLYSNFISDWVLSPEFNLNGGPYQLELDFAIMEGWTNVAAGTLGSDDEVRLLVTTDEGTTWETIQLWDQSSTLPIGGEHYIFNLEDYAGQIARFAIWASEGEVEDFANVDVSFDNFEIVPLANCPQPTQFTSQLVDFNTVELMWAENPLVSSWNIEIVNVDLGETPNGTPDYTGATNPYTVTDLEPNTNYEFYVQADCTGETSEWGGPGNFHTGYCVSVPSTVDGEGVTNVQIQSTNYPSFGDVTYEDHTANPVNLFTGWDINVNVSFLNGGIDYYTNIWIDLNDDLVFDNDTELFFQGESTFENPTTLECQFMLPSDASLGQHRMRIGTADTGQETPTPCYNGTWGVTLDFTVNVMEETCSLHQAEFTAVDDCENGDEQFMVEVEITDMGDAPEIIIGNNFNSSTVLASSIGTYQIGPFPFNTEVIVSTTNSEDANCELLSSILLDLACSPINNDCANATEALISQNSDCSLVNPGILTGASPSGISVGCADETVSDVWYHFEATNENLAISLINVDGDFGSGTPLDFVLYEGSCGNFTEIVCTSFSDSELVENLIIGETYYLRVFINDTGNFTASFDLCIFETPGIVRTDITTYTYEELVTDVLIGSDCAQINNISYSGETGLGYFYREDEGFAFENGIVMVTGIADPEADLDVAGPNDEVLGQGDWGGDADLLEYMQGLGLDPELESYNNAVVLEFDFVPFISTFNFEFIFASEEYGIYQCDFSDAFAFFLTNTETNETTNLAVVPGTTDPISVITIRDQTFNDACDSVNAEYFGTFFGENGVNPLAAPINFNGMTVPMQASTTVEVGVNYHIKLVIADRNDFVLDSAIFIKAGSLDLGELDLGVDITIEDGTAVCEGEPLVLDTGLEGTYHTWYHDYIEIPGENASTLSITEPGIYGVEVGQTTSCSIYDEINVEFLPLPNFATEIPSLMECHNNGEDISFDLTENVSNLLDVSIDPSEFSFAYYTTEQGAIDQTGEITNPTAYMNVSNPQTIYVGAINNTTGCYDYTMFEISTNLIPTPVQPSDLFSCVDEEGYASFDLESQTETITGGQTGYLVTYHASMEDADGNTGALTSPYETMPPQTIYVRMEDEMTGCYATTTFVVDQYPFEDPFFSYDEEMTTCSETGVAMATTAGGNFSIVEPVDTTASIDPDTGEITGGGSGAIYVVSYTTTGPCPQTYAVEVEMDTCIFPEVITPNDDGYNDSFDLTGFGVSSLEIFNRYGTKVYSFTGAYTDEFRGVSDDGDELPTGTYFYVVKYKDTEVRTNWFYITREQ